MNGAYEIMHHQYLTTRDIKFPDQKRYTKPGDLLLFNDANSTLTIYRNTDLVGTVHFSKGGLTEFMRLGWITHPTETNASKITVGVDTAFSPSTAAMGIQHNLDDSLTIITEQKPQKLVEERTLELPRTGKRKTSKSAAN